MNGVCRVGYLVGSLHGKYRHHSFVLIGPLKATWHSATPSYIGFDMQFYKSQDVHAANVTLQ